jgi:hypothetical protein
VLRSIANAYEAEERQQSLAHGAAAAANKGSNGR